MACAGIWPGYRRATGRLPPSRPSRVPRPTRDCGGGRGVTERGEGYWGAIKQDLLAAHLLVAPAIQGRPRPQRSRDSRLGLDRLRRRSGRSPGQPVTQVPADLDCNRKGAPSPPRSNGQAFDEARNPVTVAGRRRYKASVPAHPCWDQAVPSCSPLTGWAPGPVAASRPSRLAAALSYLTEGGRVLAGSAD